MTQKLQLTPSLASVESLTGGLFASTITSLPGASKYFKGALVTYTPEIKQKFGIDVFKGTINAQVAKDMAQIGQKMFQTNICVAFTGNAGPTPQDEQPIGKVFIAIAHDADLQVYEKEWIGTRELIRNQCVNFALEKLAPIYSWMNNIKL